MSRLNVVTYFMCLMFLTIIFIILIIILIFLLLCQGSQRFILLQFFYEVLKRLSLKFLICSALIVNESNFNKEWGYILISIGHA